MTHQHRIPRQPRRLPACGLSPSCSTRSEPDPRRPRGAGLRNSPLHQTSIAALLSSALLAGLAEAGPQQLEWTLHRVTLADGRGVVGERSSITVPESRSRPDGPTVEIAFARYRSLDPNPGPPIFFLAGGPGGPGMDLAAETAHDPRLPLIEHHDVIGIDQRGVGQSRPRLDGDEDFSFELPLDEVVTREQLAEAFGDSLERCAAHWKERGVDLSSYDSVESADDLDAVREALGAEEIILWGTSYGSHLGLSYLRRHAAAVERAVLMKVVGPDQTFKLPSLMQRRLERLDELLDDVPAIREELPDIVGTVYELLAQLEEEPVRIEVPGEGGTPISLAIGPLDLQMVVSNALGDSGNLAGLPMALHAMEHGEWTPGPHRVGQSPRRRAVGDDRGHGLRLRHQ